MRLAVARGGFDEELLGLFGKGAFRLGEEFLRVSAPVPNGAFEPFEGFCDVLFDALPVTIKIPEPPCGFRIALPRRGFVPIASLGIVLLRSFAVVVG